MPRYYCVCKCVLDEVEADDVIEAETIAEEECYIEDCECWEEHEEEG